MPLSEQQRTAIRVLDWLYDDSEGSRDSGRSYSQAIAFIRKAAKNPGHWVYVRDHYMGNSHVDYMVLDVVRSLVSGDPELRNAIEVRRDIRQPSFRFSSNMVPIHDWMPGGELPLPGSTTEGQIEAFAELLQKEVVGFSRMRPTLWQHLEAD